MSVGGGKSESEQSSSSNSFIDPGQLQQLQQMWSSAGNQVAGGFGQGGFGQGQQFINQIGNNPFQSNLMQFAQPNNEMVQGNIDMLGQNLQDQFNNTIMPGIQSNAIGAGALGGGRQGVAQGLAAQGVSDAFAEGSQGIMNNAYNQANQASQFGSNFNTQQAMAGLSGLGQFQQQQFAPMDYLARILGNPAILNQSQGSRTSSSMDFSFTGKAPMPLPLPGG